MDISIYSGSVFRRFGPKTAYKMIKDAGFDAIDWSLEGEWDRRLIAHGNQPPLCIYDKPYEELEQYFSEHICAIKENGLNVAQAHAPFPPFIKGDPEFTARSIDIYKKLLRLCKKADCPYLVVHPLSYKKEFGLSIQEVFDFNIDMYSALIPAIKEYGVIVLLENMFIRNDGFIFSGSCSYPEEAIKLIDTLNGIAGGECFGFCLDTGHLDLVRSDFYAYLYKMGTRVKALHIHDNYGMDDDHITPMTGGVICWDYVCKSLRQNGYKGDINLEVLFSKHADSMLASALTLAADSAKILREKVEG